MAKVCRECGTSDTPRYRPTFCLPCKAAYEATRIASLPRERECSKCGYFGDAFSPGKARCKKCCCEYMQDRYKKNPEVFRERSLTWARNHPEKIREKNREWTDSGRGAEVQRNYYRKNRKKCLTRAANCASARKGVSGSHTERDWRRLLARYGGKCAYCGDVATSRDHVVPISRGGSNYIGNILPACSFCNTSKHKRFITEWKKWQMAGMGKKGKNAAPNYKDPKAHNGGTPKGGKAPASQGGHSGVYTPGTKAGTPKPC